MFVSVGVCGCVCDQHGTKFSGKNESWMHSGMLATHARHTRVRSG